MKPSTGNRAPRSISLRERYTQINIHTCNTDTFLCAHTHTPSWYSGTDVRFYFPNAGFQRKPQRKIVQLRPSNCSELPLEGQSLNERGPPEAPEGPSGDRASRAPLLLAGHSFPAPGSPLKEITNFIPKMALKKLKKNCCSSAVLVHRTVLPLKWLVTCNFIKDHLTEVKKRCCGSRWDVVIAFAACNCFLQACSPDKWQQRILIRTRDEGL